MSIALIIVSIMLLVVSVVSFWLLSKKQNIDKQALNKYKDNIAQLESDYENKIKEFSDLHKDYIALLKDKDIQISQLKELEYLISAKHAELTALRENYALTLDSLDKDAEQKRKALEAEYNNHIAHIQENINKIINSFKSQEEEVMKSLQMHQGYLNSIIEAQKREQEKKDNIEFYKISLTDNELSDVKKLLDLSYTLNQPDVLKKLVYKTYFEKKMNDLLGRVIGVNSEVSGIYKITHIESGLAYIGQATNLKERWRKHLKCGLGIETPATNAFYKGMMQYYPWNFTWEVLEFCSKDRLNDAEKYYIDFYQTKTWGWNSKGGNTK